MAEECTHDCSTCGANCSSRQDPQDMTEKLNDYSSVKKVIGIVSGKGGVGKSTVTSLMAVMFSRMGYHAAILDADITGPSIPKAFGIHEKAMGSVIWRGPVLAGAVKQFWTDVVWKDVDYMFVDMPPGTGDVPLTVFQSLPLDGIIIVTSPQDLVSMIVGKAVRMAQMMNVPILGIIENMSCYVCPDCGKKHYPFGESKLENVAKEYSLEILGRFPIDAACSLACDNGTIESVLSPDAQQAADKLEKILIGETG